jgi:autotransporter strand-loop-strand O-heptosyltransferase
MYENVSRQKIASLDISGMNHTVSFLNGAKVVISGVDVGKKRRVEFWNGDNLEYFTSIGPGYFASPSKQYSIKWRVKIFEEDGTLVEEVSFNPKGKRIFVDFDSSSIGDNIAWVPQVIEFARITECKLAIKTFYNWMFEEAYPEVEWVTPGGPIGEAYSIFKLGYFYGEDWRNYTPSDPRTTPLGKVAADILGIPYAEIRPKMRERKNSRIIDDKYVVICTESTAAAKYWQRANGWQDVVDYLKYRGFQVLVVQKNASNLNGAIDIVGKSLNEVMDVVRDAEFVIGLPSGISWLAWGLKKEVIMISGFSMEWAEFMIGNHRVQNKKSCHGCWNDPSHVFDKGDWNWCPRLKGTDRQFECTTTIGVVDVIEKIDSLI